MLGFITAAQDGSLRRPMTGNRLLEGMWAPSTVDLVLSAIQERYERVGKVAPCSWRASGYRRVRSAMTGYANAYANADGRRRSAEPLDFSTLPSIEDVLADATAWDRALRTAILGALRLGLPAEGLVAAARTDLRVVGESTSILATPSGPRLLECEHSGPLGRVGCARCALHDCAESEHPGDRLISWNESADPSRDAINLAHALRLRARHWPAAQLVSGPAGLHLELTGSDELQVATELALLVASHHAGLVRLRTLAAFQISARVGRSTRAIVCDVRRDDVATDVHRVTLLLDRSGSRTLTLPLTAQEGDIGSSTPLNAFWLWLSLMEAAGGACDGPVFCAVGRGGRGLNPARWLSPDMVQSMHRRGNGALPTLAGVTTRSPRTGFAEELAANGARLMDLTLALGLAKPETVLRHYPHASGERSRVVLATFLDLLHRAP